MWAGAAGLALACAGRRGGSPWGTKGVLWRMAMFSMRGVLKVGWGRVLNACIIAGLCRKVVSGWGGFVSRVVSTLVDAAGRYATHLEPAQDALGRFNDTVVALRSYREVVGSDPQAWFAVGWLSAQLPAMARDCRKAVGRLEQVERFWKER